MATRKVVLDSNGTPTASPSTEDIQRLSITGLSGKVYYGVSREKSPLDKEYKDYLYKLHLFSIFNFVTKEYDQYFFKWIAMWNTEVQKTEKYSSIEEAITAVLKLGWKVSMVGNEVNDAIIYKVNYS